MVKLALSVSPEPATRLKVCVCPTSGSVAVSVPTVAPAALFSAILVLESVMSVGAKFAMA